MNVCDGYSTLNFGSDEGTPKIVATKCCIKRKPTDIIKTWNISEFLKIENLYFELNSLTNYMPEFFDKSVMLGWCPQDIKECNWSEIKQDIHKIEISLDKSCNLKCKFCHIHQKVPSLLETQKNLLDITYKILNDLKGHNLSVRFTDVGEPFFYKKRFMSFLQSLNKDDFSELIFITNGTLLNTEDIYTIKNIKIPKYISISLNGWDEESYLKLCGANFFFKVLENIKTLKKEGMEYHVTFVASNCEEIDHIAHFIKSNIDIFPKYTIYIDITNKDFKSLQAYLKEKLNELSLIKLLEKSS